MEILKQVIVIIVTVMTITFPLWSIGLILLDAWIYDINHDYCDVIG